MDEIGQMWVNIPHTLANIGQYLSGLTNIGQIWPTAAKNWRKSANVGRDCAAARLAEQLVRRLLGNQLGLVRSSPGFPCASIGNAWRATFLDMLNNLILSAIPERLLDKRHSSKTVSARVRRARAGAHATIANQNYAITIVVWAAGLPEVHTYLAKACRLDVVKSQQTSRLRPNFRRTRRALVDDGSKLAMFGKTPVEFASRLVEFGPTTKVGQFGSYLAEYGRDSTLR